MANGEEKTESATPRRRSEAKKKGQVAKSADLSSIFVLMGILMALGTLVSNAAHVVTVYFEKTFTHLDDIRLTQAMVRTIGSDVLLTVARAAGPPVLMALVLGVCVNIAQTGPMWATQALQPDFNRLNPLTGAQRFLSARIFVELFKNMYKIGVIGVIAYFTIRQAYPQLALLSRVQIGQGVGLIAQVVSRMSLRVVATMLILAALDYAYQRWQFEKQLRMTKQEVRQEFKQQEGSPQIKARIRARQREIAKKRMMADVPTADVVITNPTHYAVALKYDTVKSSAPMVVAKGQDLLAQKIRDIAQMNDVPIVENVQLARALYKSVDVGREIPGDLYEAVAEVLAFVYQINAKRRQRAGVPR